MPAIFFFAAEHLCGVLVTSNSEQFLTKTIRQQCKKYKTSEGLSEDEYLSKMKRVIDFIPSSHSQFIMAKNRGTDDLTP